MMPSSLYSVEGKNHFITKRFDREEDEKKHTQTLAAIYPDANSYEHIIEVCRKLHLPESDCQEVFRRMIFNILANNTDDHNKNFSFIIQKDGYWRLSPAYDITYVWDNGGFLPNEHHCLYIRAKLSGITRDDVMQFARDNGIRRPESIIRNVAESLKQFRSIAVKNGVRDELIGRIEKTIIDHLKAWDEWGEETGATEMTVNGHAVTDFRIEQQLKGNYLLQAVVDGKSRKYIIRKGMAEHEELTKTGIASVTAEMIYELVRRFFLEK